MQKVWMIGCTHFGDKHLLAKERHQFRSIKEHDDYIVNKINEMVKVGDKIWFLGDFGDAEVANRIKCNKKYLILGNHDLLTTSKYYEYFDGVYDYPVYLSKNIVLSHQPIIKDSSVLNVHAHLHNMILEGQLRGEYLNVSSGIYNSNFTPTSLDSIQNMADKLEEENWLFLYEPYANESITLDLSREDISFDPETGKVDVEKSKLMVYGPKEEGDERFRGKDRRTTRKKK